VQTRSDLLAFLVVNNFLEVILALDEHEPRLRAQTNQLESETRAFDGR
jgi:hypothetical protein